MLSVYCCCLLFVRRKSKQAMRDYKKVQIQLENLETSVRDRCKKEFTGTIQTCCLKLNNIKSASVTVAAKEQRWTWSLSIHFHPSPFSSPASDLMTEMMDMSSDLVGSGIPLPGLPGVCRTHFLPRPPGVATEARSGCSRESKADCGAGAGSAVQPAQQ